MLRNGMIIAISMVVFCSVPASKKLYGQADRTESRILLLASGIRVRAAPANDARLLTQLWEADAYEVRERHGAWVRIDQGWLKKVQAISPAAAILHFTRAIDVAPTAFAYSSRARAQLELNSPEPALYDAERAIQLDANYAPAWFNRGAARAQLGDVIAAAGDFNNAVRLDPAHAGAHRNRGHVSILRGEYRKAIDAFTVAIEQGGPDSRTLCDRGSCYLQIRDWARGLKDLNDATAIDPGFAKPFRRRGGALFEQRRYQEALQNFNRSVELAPDDPMGHICRAWFLVACPDAAVRDNQEAIQSAERACELTHQKSALCLEILGIAHAEGGNFDAAVSSLDRALKLIRGDKRLHVRVEGERRLFREHTPLAPSDLRRISLPN